MPTTSSSEILVKLKTHAHWIKNFVTVSTRLLKEEKETEKFALKHLLLYRVSRRQELRGHVNADINFETFHPKVSISIQYLIFVTCLFLFSWLALRL